MAVKRIFGSLLVLLAFAIYAIAPAYSQTADRIRKQFEAPPEPLSEYAEFDDLVVFCDQCPLVMLEGDGYFFTPEFWDQLIMGEQSDAPMKPIPPPEVADQIKFVLSDVIVEGSTVYAKEDFLPLYQAFLGQEITLGDVSLFAKKISSKYRRDGYLLSRAAVPEQRIRDGVVRILAIEGSIDEVIVEFGMVSVDEKPANHEEWLIKSYLRKITSSRPLQRHVYENTFWLINDLPGITAKAVLRPSITKEGDSDLVVFVDNKTIDLSYGSDNRGSRAVGPFYGSASVALNSLLGLYDQTRVRAILAAQSEEMRFFEISHEEQLGSAGTTIQMKYNQVRSRPGFTFETSTGTNLESESQELSFTLSHPFIRLHDENLTARASFLWHKTVTDFAFNALFDDRLRVAKLGLQYDFVDGFDGLTLLDVEVSQGLDILGATTSTGNSDIDNPTLSRILGRSDFTKLTAYASRLQRLPGAFSIFLAATGQYSRTQLLSSELFGFGGEYFGRAFDFSEITGDHGVAGKIELRYGRYAKTPLIKDYQFYTFWDYGAVWRIDPVINFDAHHSKTGSSAGLGVRFNVTDNISGSIEIDKPLTRDVSANGTDGEKPRVFFRLSAKF